MLFRSFRRKGKEQAFYKWVKGLRHRHPDTVFHVVYEAGRNGYTPARELRRQGVYVHLIPVNKLKVVEYGKKVKTDRIDAEFLSALDVLSSDLPRVHIPEISLECDKGLLREYHRIEKDIRTKNHQILSLIERWPVSETAPNKHLHHDVWRDCVAEWRKMGDVQIPESELFRIELLLDRMKADEAAKIKLQGRIDERDEEHRQAAAAKGEPYLVDILESLKGIGITTARAFAWEVGDFARFAPGKFGAWLGLVPVAHESCGMRKQLGISKAGNKELRRRAVGLVWLWKTWQPDSALMKKWGSRLEKGGRIRRIAAVAMARELMEAIRDLIVDNKPIEGAIKFSERSK